MSLIRAIRHQLGLSMTPGNNFVLTAQADDGTMKLARGNADATTQDIMTVDAAGKVSFPQNAAVAGSETKPSTSGTEINFTIPAGAKKIEVLFSGVSTNGTNNLSVRLGTSAGVQNSGYAGLTYNLVDAQAPANPSAMDGTGFLFRSSNAASVLTGKATLDLVDEATHRWAIEGSLWNGQSSARLDQIGTRTMNAEVTSLQITSTNKVDVFDAGQITVKWSK